MEVKLLLAFAYCLIVVGSCLSNRDLLSPAKLFLASLGVYFFDIFITAYPAPVVAVYAGLLAIATGAILAERSPGFHCQIQPHEREERISSTWLSATAWLLSIPAIVAQFVLFALAGGVDDYLAGLTTRHASFRGLGPITVLSHMIGPLTVAYFAVGLGERRTKIFWFGWMLHLTLAGTILLLSGGRLKFLTPLIVLMISWNYLRRRVRIRTASLTLGTLLVIASLLGMLRKSVVVKGDSLSFTNVTTVSMLLRNYGSDYGLVPLTLVLERPIVYPRYGSTLLTVVTDFVPRVWWPDKPDSAGKVLTIDYLDDRWAGTSYLNAGIIAEGVLNFGKIVGCAFGLLVISLSLLYLSKQYATVRETSRRRGLMRSLQVARYGYIVFAVTGLCTWDSVIVFVPLFINIGVLRLFQHILVRLLKRQRRDPRQRGLVHQELRPLPLLMGSVGQTLALRKELSAVRRSIGNANWNRRLR